MKYLKLKLPSDFIFYLVNRVKKKSFYLKIFVFFFIILTSKSRAQYYSFDHMKTVSYTGHILSSDDRGNILIGSKQKLTKLSANGEFIAQYEPMYHAKISSIDVKDPRRILILYPGLSYLVFLNQDLVNAGSISAYQIISNPKPINLDDLNLSYIKLACLDEYNDSYWLYDENTSEILLMDDENNIDFRGDALDDYTELQPNPNFMVMENNRLFINNPSSGVYIFDENGRFVRKLPLMGLKKLQAEGDKLYYASNSFLVIYDLVTDEEKYHPLPVLNFKDWSLNLNSKPARINFLTNDGVVIYSMELEN